MPAIHRKRQRCSRRGAFCALLVGSSLWTPYLVEAFVRNTLVKQARFIQKTRATTQLYDTVRPSGSPLSFSSLQNLFSASQAVDSNVYATNALPQKRRGTSSSKQPKFPTTSTGEEVFFPFFPETNDQTTTARSMSMPQMIAMNAVGGAMTVGVVYALASTNLNGLLTGAATEDLEAVGINIADAALPLSATDMVTVSFSEAAAALTASAVSLFFSFVARLSSRNRKRNRDDNVDYIQKAVGNGDFLLAQATALPLLESLGVPSVLATTAGVLFAAIPAEIVKVAGRKKQEKRATEDEFFEYLLNKEQEKKQLQSRFSLFPVKQAETPAEVMAEWQTSMEEKTRSQEESLLVEIFSDLIKWLGYSVLCADLGGTLVYNGLPLFPGLESATFGIIASLSAQVYADILYAYFGFGGIKKQDEVRQRTLISWASTYISEAWYAGVFFGIYEFAQIPAMASVSAFLSGGAEACYGSQDFDVCLQAFESQNPPGASPEAQLRSLVTTLVSLWNRYTPDFFPIAA